MKRNIFIAFLLIFFGLLSFVALFNYFVDPYGRYGTNLLGANQTDSRSHIVQELRRQFPSPRTLLFGSSRSLLLNPRFGIELPVMNVALYAGAIEDHYCILRYAVENLKYPIRFALIGLEADLMVNNHPIDPMLRTNEALSKYLIEENKSLIHGLLSQPRYIEEVASLLSTTTLKNSLRKVLQILLRNFRVRDASANELTVLPKRVYESFIEEIIAARKDMQARLRQYKSLYAGSVHVDRLRLEYLDRFAQYCEQKSINVVVFMPGYSDEFWGHMIKNENFVRIHRDLDGKMRELNEEYGWKIVDFRPDVWKGRELVYPDGVHPCKETAFIMSRAIEEAILNGF